MELYENRIFNGILKEIESVTTPEMAKALLAQDIEIYVHSSRGDANDLWPCVWALTVALTKQFTGTIFVRCGLSKPPPDAPSAFASTVVFSTESRGTDLQIGLGGPPSGNGHSIWGDARGNRLAFGHSLDTQVGVAHPITCFALAGYLGFAALAQTVGIPPFREEFVQSELILPFDPKDNVQFPDDGFAVLGLGQLGQAYLALLYFLGRRSTQLPSVFLLDKDSFEPVNQFTQILLTEEKDWVGAVKAFYLADRVKTWGWKGSGECRELSWGVGKQQYQPRLAILGFDDLEARRVAIEAGYEWIVDGGVGTSFARPRVTWHSLPPEREFASQIFASRPNDNPEPDHPYKPFFEDLRGTPGQCGWITFRNIRASAPSMGLVASAYVWAEMMSVLEGNRKPIAGTGYLWSPLLPFLRDFI